ncbi:polysaccharide biosynthesis/export family protein [Altererythrobacter sp. GH1-8]|uniref:polysaccharide biosynthesis/export family protein n=1 Tax=Altererythrobacter sp. GH1-8 TaxID=3349333 RepID=UPI00374DD618
MSHVKSVLGLLLALTLAACAGDKSLGGSPNIEVANLESLPRPTGTNPFLLTPLSEVELTVYQTPELSGTYVIDENGNIRLPLIGEMAASGQTPGDLARAMEVKLGEKFIRDPQVQVRPTQFDPPSVAVGGQVKNPGTYPISTSRSLMRAVINAGGSAEFADDEDVLIFREVNGRRYIGVYNLAGIRRGNYDDPEIYSGDIIAVGDNPQKRAIAKFLEVVPLITNTLILVDRLQD